MPKKPIYTDIVINPLHQYASWTYALSLWWMDPRDFNNLMTMPDINNALNFDLVKDAPNSYVIASDAGLFPSRRHPLTNGLTYHLQDIEIDTSIQPSLNSGPTNMAYGSFTIVEPYGVTLINVLAEAAFDTINNRYNNYLDQNYILQIDFVGYDDFGNEIPRNQTALYRKRFPVRITEMKVDVKSSGAEYRCTFYPSPHESQQKQEIRTVPYNFRIKAKTIDEFFNGKEGLAAQLNNYQKSLIGKDYEWGDCFSFDIDPEIAKSEIVNTKEASFVNSDPNSNGYDPTTKVWVIPQGTDISTIINKIMAHSSFLIGQMGLEGKVASTQTDQSSILNLFKVLTLMTHQGIVATDSLYDNVYDTHRNVYAKHYNYKIIQVPTWLSTHPSMSQFSDMSPYCTKSYDYLYTGKNIDIINWELKFDHTYFVPVLGFPNQQAASTPNAAVGNETKAQYVRQTNLTPSVLSILHPQLGQVRTATPISTATAVGNQNITTGMDVGKRPAATIVADALNSTYFDHSSSMMNINLEIVGDPTMLKQDEWAYVPSPNKAVNYYNWEEVPQSEFAAKYGHLRLDAGEIIVALSVRTPIDIDTDLTNEGLVTPELGTIPSVFNGFFRVLTIRSMFRNGKFTQILNLARYLNSDYVTAAAPMIANARPKTSTTSAALYVPVTDQLINDAVRGGTPPNSYASTNDIVNSALGGPSSPPSIPYIR